MSTNIIKFDPAYAAQLTTDLQAVLLATELGGQTNKVAVFSYAGTGNSTYSFGVLQFDVGNNPPARAFLASIGFTDAQVAQLSRQGGLSGAELAPMNALLQQNQAALDQFTQQQLHSYVTNLEGTLNIIQQRASGMAQQIYASPPLQLRLLDYMNQFGPIDANGPMVNWLCGQPVVLSGGTLQLAAGHTLTGQDVTEFILNTRYAVGAPAAARSREDRLNSALASIQTPSPVAA
jgi:hypothetical protein